MQWGTDPLTLPKGEDQNNFCVKGTYTQLQRVIQLGESLFKSHPVAQTWTIADNIHHFNNQLTNAHLNRTPLRGYRASLAFEIVAFRKKIVAGAHAGGSQASVTEWTEPNWSELKLDAPNQAPWPFKILFVGVNGSEHADLSLKEEFGKMESAFREEFNRWDDKDKPSLQQIPYSTWKDVMDQVGREYPSILHFGCHAQANGVELYGKTVRPQQMIPAIKAHNEFAREKGKGEINVIVVNACDSDKHADKLSQCVDFAIGHKAAVGDKEAIDFTDSFYCNMFKGMHLAGTFGTARSVSSKGYQLHVQKDPRRFRLALGKDGDDGLRTKRRRDDDRSASDANKQIMDIDGETRKGKCPKAGITSKVSTKANNEIQSKLLGKRADAGECSSSSAPLKSPKIDLIPAGGSSSNTTRKRLDSGRQRDVAGHAVGGDTLIRGDISAAVDCKNFFLRGTFLYDVFISHTLDKDDAGRDNHARTKRLKDSLERLGVAACFGEEHSQGNNLQRKAKCIEDSAVILICVTRQYMERVAENASNNCRLEFEHALHKRDTLNMLPIIMEESMINNSQWHGSLSMILGQCRCQTLTSDVNFEDSVKDIAVAIRRMIEPQQVFANEQHGAARQMSSRSQSPAPSVASGRDTVPASPSPGQQVLAMHMDRNVDQFREDMKQFMQSFLRSNEPAPRKWKLCELLLVAFMRDKVAPSWFCDPVLAENLEAWQGWCEDPDKNLIDAFHKLMHSLKPSVFEALEYDFAKSGKQNHTSLFVIDWMVRHSAWALAQGKRDEWAEEVVLHWFNSENTETSDCLLERAETFLRKGVKGISWGAKILGKVIPNHLLV